MTRSDKFGALLALLLSGTVLTARPSQPVVDLLIVNARIIDGSGARRYTGSLAIDAGRIVRINPPADLPARERIDARGQVVAPGFIDVHTHAADLAQQPDAARFIRIGVTTIVAGNSGSSALDIGTALEDVMAAGPAVNFATLIGHNTVREAVMGRANRPPTVSELQKMKGLVFKAMVDGAVGLSTGLQHVPGAYAQEAEIVELARVAANNDGLYAPHIRSDGTAVLELVAESINVGVLLKMPVEISLSTIDSPRQWGSATRILDAIDAARKRGIDVGALTMSDSDVEAFIKHPMIGIASDAGLDVVSHPSGDGYTMRVLSHYVRDGHSLRLEEAVRKMSGLPARQFGFAQRGEIHEGWAADLVIFDPDTVGESAASQAPNPSGMSYVIVNGQVALNHGLPTAARTGQVLRRRR